MTTSHSKVSLRGYQVAAHEAIQRGFAEYQRQLLVLPTGCHAAGSLILMGDGSLKAVEDIVVGEQVMGPDSAPRTVLHLHRGREAMFRITPTKGEPFIVNAGHILHLRRTRVGKPGEDAQPWTREISVSDYLETTRYFRHLHKLHRVAVAFPDQGTLARPLDPYILGVLLGDGSLHHANICVTTPDPEIVAALTQYAQWVGSAIRHENMPDNQAANYYFRGRERGFDNEFVRSAVRRLGVDVSCEFKFVPAAYKVAAIEVRKAVLAGLLDTDGFLNRSGYEFTSRSKQLADDVVFISRSLGLAAYVGPKIVNGETYQRVSISGDCSGLPLRIRRKRAPRRRQIKDVLVTGFQVEAAGEGSYFGFELDGDHLYLDGSLTVHHNSGKTVVLAHLAATHQPRRTLVLAHREELITQAVDKIRAVTGLIPEVEMADYRASLNAPVVVASVQTLLRSPRRERWPRDHFGLVVVDEAHHSLADSYLNTLRYFDENAFVLGVTATPDRGDKKNLGRYFQNIPYEVTLLDLVQQNWLAPIRVKTVPLEIDLDDVGTTAGDYNANDLGHAIEPYLERIADVLAEHARRKILVFLPLISLSQDFAALCRDRGLRAEHVDGTSEDRKEILARFTRGETRVLTNAMLLTEGYDEPSIDCVVCLRPTKIRSLYSQIVGRGTRLYPGKDHLLLLDFLWMSEEHALMKPANLIAADAEEANAITGALGFGGDLAEAKGKADADRAATLRQRLRQNAKRNARTFDALEFALSLGDVELADFVPTMPWHGDPATGRQREVLSRFGVDPGTLTCKGQAAALLDKLFLRRDLGLASARQVLWLRKLGHPKPELATFEEAKQFLDSKWSKPAGQTQP